MLFLVNCVIWFANITFLVQLKLLAFFKFLQFLIVFHTSIVLEKKNEFLEYVLEPLEFPMILQVLNKTKFYCYCKLLTRTQLTFTCSNSTIETLEKVVK